MNVLLTLIHGLSSGLEDQVKKVKYHVYTDVFLCFKPSMQQGTAVSGLL
ncbi:MULTISPECIES: hypothetical protein [Cytobacillus]|nr:hypothetical protein [Cytobacillus firmus]